MKGNGFTRAFKKVTSTLLIAFLVMQFVLPVISSVKAASIPVGIIRVTDQAKKDKLLGTTSEKAKEKNIFGLAQEFSLFTKENVTLTNADSEGRIAAGGTVTATTNYKYQVNTENYKYEKADIIAQNGFSNIELLFNKHTTVSSNSYENSNKKIAVVGMDPTSMDWSEFTDDEKARIRASDLIDFNSEFDYIQSQSNYYANIEANGEIIENAHIYMGNRRSHGDTRAAGIFFDAVIFRGNDTKLNIFTMTIDQLNELRSKTLPTDASFNPHAYNWVFDVPDGSSVLINIIGEGNVDFFTETSDWQIDTAVANIFFLQSQSEGVVDNDYSYAYLIEGEDFVRNEDTSLKKFKGIYGYTDSYMGNEKNEMDLYGSRILFNLPQANSFRIKSNLMGSIIAPNANGSDNGAGYITGTVACKSYSGGSQFGYVPFQVGKEYQVNIDKFFYGPTPNEDAEFKVTDINGEVIDTWTTRGGTKTLYLPEGTYTLEETKVPSTYLQPENNKVVFNVSGKIDGTSNISLGRKSQVEKSISLGGGEDAVEALSKNPYRQYSKIEWEIELPNNISEDELYYVVASNGYGLPGPYVKTVVGTPVNGYNTTWDWLEFKQWTSVKEGITCDNPVVGPARNNGYDGKVEMDHGFKAHFFTSDGTEVTDQITIKNIKLIQYEMDDSYSTTPENFIVRQNTYTIDVINEPISFRVNLKKTNAETGEPLEGAVYRVVYENGESVGSYITTTADGTALSSEYNYINNAGTFYLKEVVAPEGYVLSRERIPFEVKPNANQTINLDVTDRQIRVKKQDEFGNGLSGATVHFSHGGQFVSEANGNIISGGLRGDTSFEYVLRELEAPRGFERAENITFTVSDDGHAIVNGNEVSDIVMEDKLLRASINISKTGEILNSTEALNNNNGIIFNWANGAIKGVTYELYAKEDVIINGTTIYSKDEKIGEQTTGANGIATFNDLPMGEYYVIETSAPEGYEIDRERKNVSLIPIYEDLGYGEKDQTLSAVQLDLTDERKTETVQVTKTEPDGTTPVKGAQYGLYNQEAIGNITANTLLDTATTNDDGQATFTVDLPVGNYYVKEIEAPNGYLLSEESKYINFKESQNFSLNFTDDYTKVKIAKTDKNGNAISGAELKLVEKRTGTTVETWTSDSSPKTIERKLEPGKTYTLQETKAPAGYTTAENKDFVVLETGDIQEIQFVNNPTVVSITKTSLDNQILQGARLKLVEMSTDDVTGEPVETQIGEAWETTNTKKLFEGVLETGKTYKIVELTPPTGYATAQPVTFTVADTDAEQAQEIRDGKTKVKILKQDESGNNITGARLQLLNSSGTALEEWTSTVDGYEIEGELTVGATYKVRELQAPAGYVQAVQDVEFTVSDTTNLQTVVFSNKATVVEINKLDESGNKLAGATLQLFDENNNVVDVWVSTTSGHRVENKLIYGKTYTLKEVKAPAGYATADDVTFTVGSTSAVKQEVNMSDSKLKVAVAKQNEQNELIAGAELKITDSQGTTVETFTSATTAHEVEAKLEIGKTYFLCETKPAPGYLSTQDVPFTVADSKQTQTITMTDKKTKLSFVKYDENEELVPGAKFELVDNNGTVVESWTTGNTAHDVEGKLEVGKSYTLRETETPEGYAKATDYRFTVDDVKVSTTQNVTIIEKGICVEVSKLDEQGNQISGAELKVLDSEGEEVASWTTDGSAHRLMNTLSAGNTYTLRETKPAPGYVTAEDITMEVQDTEQVQAFRMTDKKTKVAISKVDASNNAVSGATLQLWDGNQIIDEWVSESTAKQFVGKLVVGKTYTLKETNAPDGYAQAAEKTFTVRDTEEVQSVTMKNTKTKISVSKKDKETEEELAGAELKVTKVDGTEVESWTSAATPHVLEGKLVAGETYILEETKPAEGYVTAEKVIFKVRDTEEIQNVVMKDEKTVFSIEKVKPTGDKLAGAELTITDDEGTEVAKWTTTEDAHEIKGMLAVGKTYTIRETVTPDGYVTAEPKTFTVEDTKEKQEITITNKTTRAEFRKTDKETGKALENAELKLVEVVTDDVTGEETEEAVETWTTGALPYVMDGKLVVGHTYKLIEMEAPEDYKVADPVSFTVENTPEIQIVEMQDEYDHKEITVKVSKQDIVTCEPIEGAELSLQTVEGEEIESWTTTSSAHRIEANLEIGEAYKVVEKSTPQGYVKAQDVLFRVQKTEEVQEVIIKEDYTKVKVEKVDEEGKYVSGAELQIVDQNGNVIEQWITEKEAHELDKVLKAGETYKLRESTVPTGYEKMDDVSFTVSENGQVDTITAVNRKLTVAEITKGIISNVAPKTGDYMIIYLGVFMIAICGLAVIVIRKKHEKKDASKK